MTHWKPNEDAPARLLTLCGIDHIDAFLSNGGYPKYVRKLIPTCPKCLALESTRVVKPKKIRNVGVHPDLLKHLTSIFMWVADACDGGGRFTKQDMDGIKEAYNEALKNEAVQKFYDELVDANHAIVFGEDGK